MQRCGLEIINIMNNDGSLNAAAGAYEGLDRFDARKKLWADIEVRPLLDHWLLYSRHHSKTWHAGCSTVCKHPCESRCLRSVTRPGDWGMLRLSCVARLGLGLQEAGLAIREEPYTMRVPRSQRGGEVIEPLVREQWFVSMRPLAEPALRVRPPRRCSHAY